MSGNNGCLSFEKIMGECSEKLEDIRFSGTRARAEGSAHIALALSSLAQKGNLKNITRLDLADNTFSDCFKDIASALSHCSKLEYLNLHDCMLSDEGTEEICKALMGVKAPLTFLDLSGNEITAEGSKSVAKLVKSLNGTLATFLAEENEMTSYGVKRVVKALHSTSLKMLILNQNECGVVGGNAIIDMVGGDGVDENVNRVPNLEAIQLDYNMFPAEMVERLTQTFGDKLAEMEDNDDEEDADADLEEEDEEEDAVAEGGPSAGVDALIMALGEVTI
eukprot:CAMPEP_0197235654 /NCGR_PEP_ID=MMETSP1429-20130617/3026_1 /TAXON_ID=49237 /ORGANISM="Chaetoceros  sp., Strain UNC1202" /LENGTH=277 /DNA_ID=CAMNT_0042694295 /DNA_START=1 /DNA_END=834 /DNA_ORIENTATION=-